MGTGAQPATGVSAVPVAKTKAVYVVLGPEFLCTSVLSVQRLVMLSDRPCWVCVNPGQSQYTIGLLSTARTSLTTSAVAVAVIVFRTCLPCARRRP
jgi:hypothetical protein